MAIKHAYRQNENVITQYGEVNINNYGFVTNLETLNCSEEELLELPNFINGATFKSNEDESQTQEEKQEEPAKVEKAKSPTEAEYKEFILKLEASKEGQSQLNSEGYLEMDYLNKELRAVNWPIIAGAKRKSLTDKARFNAQTPGKPKE